MTQSRMDYIKQADIFYLVLYPYSLLIKELSELLFEHSVEQSCTLMDGVENISFSVFQFPIFQPFFWLERRQLPHETGTVRGAAHLLWSVPGFGMLQQTSTA